MDRTANYCVPKQNKNSKGNLLPLRQKSQEGTISVCVMWSSKAVKTIKYKKIDRAVQNCKYL